MIKRSQLEKWNAGKYDDLTQTDMIVLCLYFQNLSEGYESQINENE